MNSIIENENLKIEVSTQGAEIQRIYNKKNNKDYLWNGDKEFWGRRSPVLFPFVGALKNKEYVYNGKKYPMGQHGFARDMEFELIEKNENSITYELKSSQGTLEKYPFEFSLKINYELEGNKINVKWLVENTDIKKMYFSIGAHPAFLVPVENREECFIKFDSEAVLNNTGLEKRFSKQGKRFNSQFDNK